MWGAECTWEVRQWQRCCSVSLEVRDAGRPVEEGDWDARCAALSTSALPSPPLMLPNPVAVTPAVACRPPTP